QSVRRLIPFTTLFRSRMIVHEDLYDDFVAKLTERMSSLRLGDPPDEDTDVAPLHEESAAEGLMEQVQDAIDKGATVHCGGKRPRSEEHTSELQSRFDL